MSFQQDRELLIWNLEIIHTIWSYLIDRNRATFLREREESIDMQVDERPLNKSIYRIVNLNWMQKEVTTRRYNISIISKSILSNSSSHSETRPPISVSLLTSFPHFITNLQLRTCHETYNHSILHIPDSTVCPTANFKTCLSSEWVVSYPGSRAGSAGLDGSDP